MPRFAALGACVHGGKGFGEPRGATSCICRAKACVLWLLCKSCAVRALHCLSSVDRVPQASLYPINETSEACLVTSSWASWPSPGGRTHAVSQRPRKALSSSLSPEKEEPRTLVSGVGAAECHLGSSGVGLEMCRGGTAGGWGWVAIPGLGGDALPRALPPRERPCVSAGLHSHGTAAGEARACLWGPMAAPQSP